MQARSHTPTSESVAVLTGRFDDLLAHGLRAVIESDASVRLLAWGVEDPHVGTALRLHRPDVAILACAALASPVEVRRLRALHPQTRLVLLTDRPSRAECAQMLAFGASACLATSTEARDILNAIHLASRGLQIAPGSEGPDGSARRSDLLTRREAEVLELLREALPNAQIAAALHVSVETVRTHARSIYRKLGVSSRRELLPALAAEASRTAAARASSPSERDRPRPRRGARRPSHG